jgi:hypothetical protein
VLCQCSAPNHYATRRFAARYCTRRERQTRHRQPKPGRQPLPGFRCFWRSLAISHAPSARHSRLPVTSHASPSTTASPVCRSSPSCRGRRQPARVGWERNGQLDRCGWLRGCRGAVYRSPQLTSLREYRANQPVSRARHWSGFIHVATLATENIHLAMRPASGSPVQHVSVEGSCLHNGAEMTCSETIASRHQTAYSVSTPNRVHVAAGQDRYCTYKSVVPPNHRTLVKRVPERYDFGTFSTP